MSAKVWVVGLGLALAGTGWVLRERIASLFTDEEEQAIEGVDVRRGPLRISVVERGNLKAADSISLKSEIEGETTILFLVEEGTEVKTGDLLCELDTADLVERRVQQEIAVQNAEAAYVKAKQNYEIQVSQNTSEIARAERELEFARLDLAKYIEGDWLQEQKQADEEILIADEELSRAEEELQWSERLAERGFLENTQLEQDRLARTRAEITLNQKTRAKELLEQYEYPRKKSELDADVEEKGRELERVRLQAKAKIVDFEAETRTSKARFDLESEKLRKLDSQIVKARMHAPVDGMVVYYQEPGRRWGSSEPLQEGSEVRERQEIITIPSTEGMIAEASLHESVLDRVKEGMPCVVTVDAFPERTFPGEIKYKGVLPDQNSWWANPDLRVYRTEVRLLETEDRLRPGMSCSIEIVVEDLADVLYIPMQSVFLDEAKPVAFVSVGGEIEKRPIELGQNNGIWSVVASGLEEGQQVLLSQPPGFDLQAAPLDRGKGEPGQPGEGRDGKPQAKSGEAGQGREGRSGKDGEHGREGREAHAASPGGEGSRAPSGSKPAEGRPSGEAASTADAEAGATTPSAAEAAAPAGSDAAAPTEAGATAPSGAGTPAPSAAGTGAPSE